MEKQGDYKTETDEALEMPGKGYNGDPIPPTEFISTLSGFTPAPDVIIAEHGFVAALVWGIAWRFCQMSDGVCRAGLPKIADRLGMSERTIIRHLDVLCNGGYLFDMTPDLKNKPHIYADTGKVKIRFNVEAGVTESQRAMTLSHPAMTESQRQGDRESVEESIKKEIKKQKEEEAASPLSQEELQKANKIIDGILANERKARQLEDDGQAWRGRELLPPQYIPYGDWWHTKTGLQMYAQKGKAKINTEWLKAFQVWWENDITVDTLEQVYDAEKSWKGIIGKPGELTTKAVALQMLPSRKPKEEKINPEQEAIAIQAGLRLLEWQQQAGL